MATTVAKQYGNALPGTSGTPSATNRYVTDADPRLTNALATEATVAELEQESVTLADVLRLVSWLSARVQLLEAVTGTVDAIAPPPEVELLEEVQ